MYAIHTTPGFIIDTRPTGEAGKTLSIFTRDLGLVRAVAQGIRLEKSKLRYHTWDYSFGVFSFVRGKEYWRLTSASESQISDYKTQKHIDNDQREFLAKLALILKKLLHGEEPHPELFGIIEGCYEFLSCNEISEEDLKTLESLIVLRILHGLGYIGKDEQLTNCLERSNVTDELLETCRDMRILMNTHINK